MAVAASTAVTAGVTAPMAQQAYEARSEQASAMLAVDDVASPSTTLPSSSDQAVSDRTGPGPTLPPTVPSTTPSTTAETVPAVTPQSIVVTPTTVAPAAPSTETVPPSRPSAAPPALTAPISAPTTTSPPTTAPPPSIAQPITTMRATTTTERAPTTTTTTTSTSTSTSTTSTSTTSTSTSTTTSTTIPTSSDSIYLSTHSDRSDRVLLEGESVIGDIYVFVDWPGASVVRFYIDNVNHTGAPDKVENHDPFDLGGTAPDGSAWAFDTTALDSGEHTVTVEIVDGGINVRTATFTVG